MTLQRYTDGSAELVIDEGYAPLIVMTWFGEPTNQLIDKYLGWARELIADNVANDRKIAVVADCREVVRPDATVRRYYADHAEDDPSLIISVAVIDSALVRGALTAIRWVLGDRFAVVSVPTLEEAFERAFEAVEAVGLTAPREALADYEVPTPLYVDAPRRAGSSA